MIVWVTAVIFWILDRVLCDFWIRIDLPYFHSVFHLIAFYSSYWSIVLYSYFKAVDTVPQFKASIAYWPDIDNNFHLFSIPYIEIMVPTNNTQNILENAYKNGSSENKEAINLENYKFA